MNFKHRAKQTIKFVHRNASIGALVLALVAVGISSYNLYIAKTVVPVPSGIGSNIKTAGLFKELSKDLPFLGNPDAEITIVEFGDFQCPFCGRFFKETLPTLKKEYLDTGKYKFIYMDYAFLGEESRDAAEAAKCANEQGKFWEYYNKLYSSQKGENKGAFSSENLRVFASDIGLDISAFDACVAQDKYREAIDNELLLGKKYGITGTPGFIVGNKNKAQGMKGAALFPEFKRIIEGLVK